jgi:hypothetical protein
VLVIDIDVIQIRLIELDQFIYVQFIRIHNTAPLRETPPNRMERIRSECNELKRHPIIPEQVTTVGKKRSRTDLSDEYSDSELLICVTEVALLAHVTNNVLDIEKITKEVESKCMGSDEIHLHHADLMKLRKFNLLAKQLGPFRFDSVYLVSRSDLRRLSESALKSLQMVSFKEFIHPFRFTRFDDHYEESSKIVNNIMANEMEVYRFLEKFYLSQNQILDSRGVWNGTVESSNQRYKRMMTIANHIMVSKFSAEN